MNCLQKWNEKHFPNKISGKPQFTWEKHLNIALKYFFPQMSLTTGIFKSSVYFERSLKLSIFLFPYPLLKISTAFLASLKKQTT